MDLHPSVTTNQDINIPFRYWFNFLTRIFSYLSICSNIDFYQLHKSTDREFQSNPSTKIYNNPGIRFENYNKRTYKPWDYFRVGLTNVLSLHCLYVGLVTYCASSIYGTSRLPYRNCFGNLYKTGDWQNTLICNVMGYPAAFAEKRLTLRAYSFVVLILVYARFHYTRIFTRFRIDVAAIRMLYDADRETRVIDLVIRGILESTKESLYFLRLKLLSQFKGETGAQLREKVWPSDEQNFLLMTRLMDKNKYQLNKYLDQSSEQSKVETSNIGNETNTKTININSLRPKSYSKDSLSRHRLLASILIIIISLLTIFISVTLSIHFCVHFERTKDEIGLIDEEKYVTRYLLFSINVIGYFCISSQTYLLSSFCLTILLLFHFRQLQELKECLIECLEASRHLNQTFEQFEEQDMEYIEKILLEGYIRLKTHLFESRRCSRAITWSLELTTMGSSSLFVLNLYAWAMRLPTIGNIRITVVIWTWFLTNLIVLICANSSAKMAQLQRIAWSILGQNVHRMSKRNSKLCDNFVCLIWRRLVFSFAEIGGDLTPGWFGERLSYRRILERNFFVISLGLFIALRN